MNKSFWYIAYTFSGGTKRGFGGMTFVSNKPHLQLGAVTKVICERLGCHASIVSFQPITEGQVKEFAQHFPASS